MDGKDNLFLFYENFYVGGFILLCGFGLNFVGFKVVYCDYLGLNNGFDIVIDDLVGGNVIVFVSVELIVLMLFVLEEVCN